VIEEEIVEVVPENGKNAKPRKPKRKCDRKEKASRKAGPSEREQALTAEAVRSAGPSGGLGLLFPALLMMLLVASASFAVGRNWGKWKRGQEE